MFVSSSFPHRVGDDGGQVVGFVGTEMSELLQCGLGGKRWSLAKMSEYLQLKKLEKGTLINVACSAFGLPVLGDRKL